MALKTVSRPHSQKRTRIFKEGVACNRVKSTRKGISSSSIVLRIFSSLIVHPRQSAKGASEHTEKKPPAKAIKNGLKVARRNNVTSTNVKMKKL